MRNVSGERTMPQMYVKGEVYEGVQKNRFNIRSDHTAGRKSWDVGSARRSHGFCGRESIRIFSSSTKIHLDRGENHSEQVAGSSQIQLAQAE